MKNKFELVIMLSLFLAACSGNQKPVDLTPKIKPGNNFQFGIVSEKKLSTFSQLPGQLVPFNQVNLFPKINSFVKKLYVDRGSIVKKGQLLVILEAPEMESQLEAAKSQYLRVKEDGEASQQKYERLKEASKEPGSVSPLDLDDAQAKMKADQARVKSEGSNVASVKTMESYLRIYAPFDGVIIERNISPGALVAPGKATDQPMFVLQDAHKMRLTVSIPEDYVDKVDLNQAVTFKLNAMPGQQYVAKISRSANSLGSMQQEAIEIDVVNTQGNLKPGMYAEVKIPMLTGAKSLLIPSNAIIRSTESEYVIKDSIGKAHLINIKEGLANKDSTEVFGNLKFGDSILLHGNYEIKEGVNLN